MARVLVIEDQIDHDAVEDAFARDAARHRDPAFRLELAGLAQNHTDALEQLADLAASPQGLPDAVVVDDFLPDGATASSRMVRIMAGMLDLCRREDIPIDERPRTVLWSSCEPNFVYTFCVLGGLQYQHKKEAKGQDVPVGAIWRALAGQRWRPSPYPGATDLTPDMRRALPALEHGFLQKQVARELGLAERGLSGFVQRVARLVPEGGELPVNDASALRVLRERGWVWVPYRLGGQLPAGLPLPEVIDPVAHLQDLPPRGAIPVEYLTRRR